VSHFIFKILITFLKYNLHS